MVSGFDGSLADAPLDTISDIPLAPDTPSPIDAGPDAPPQCGWSTGSHTVEAPGIGGAREVLLVRPADARGPTPLILAFHGQGWSSESFRSATRLEDALPGSTIAYPQALPDGSGRPTWALDAGGIDVAFADALVDQLVEAGCVERSRIGAFGRSYGGFFTNALACARPTLFRAITTTIAGGPLDACAAQLPVWMSATEDDPTVPFSLSTGQRDHWLMADGCAGPPTHHHTLPCDAWTECAAGTEVVFCAARTGGHVPPPFTVGEAADFLTRHLR